MLQMFVPVPCGNDRDTRYRWYHQGAVLRGSPWVQPGSRAGPRQEAGHKERRWSVQQLTPGRPAALGYIPGRVLVDGGGPTGYCRNEGTKA